MTMTYSVLFFKTFSYVHTNKTARNPYNDPDETSSETSEEDTVEQGKPSPQSLY